MRKRKIKKYIRNFNPVVQIIRLAYWVGLLLAKTPNWLIMLAVTAIITVGLLIGLG